jgi:hypothetical protein
MMFDTIKLKMKVLKDRFFRKKEPEKFYIKKGPRYGSFLRFISLPS